MVEQSIHNRSVVGSNPSAPTILKGNIMTSYTRPLTAVEKTNKIKRIRRGVTLYKVYAFPETKSASIMVIKATGPVKVEIRDTHSYEFIPTLLGDYFSTRDAKLRYQTSNAHRTFFSLKRAKRYAKLIESGCWPVDYKEPWAIL